MLGLPPHRASPRRSELIAGRRDAGSISPDRWLFAAAGLAVYVGLYFGVGLYGAPPSRSLATPIDRLVPFCPAAIWVYASVFPAILAPVLLVRSPARFRRIGWSLIGVVVICAACFALLPVETASLRQSIPTGSLAGPDRSFTEWGLQLLFALDPPRNAFPSLHMALATVLALGVGRSPGSTHTPSRRGLGGQEATSSDARELQSTPWPAYLWLGAVFASVLLVRQHYLLDALAGLALGVLAYRVGVGPDADRAESAESADRAESAESADRAERDAFRRRGVILLAVGVAAAYTAMYALYAAGVVPTI